VIPPGDLLAGASSRDCVVSFAVALPAGKHLLEIRVGRHRRGCGPPIIRGRSLGYSDTSCTCEVRMLLIKEGESLGLAFTLQPLRRSSVTVQVGKELARSAFVQTSPWQTDCLSGPYAPPLRQQVEAARVRLLYRKRRHRAIGCRLAEV